MKLNVTFNLMTFYTLYLIYPSERHDKQLRDCIKSILQISINYLRKHKRTKKRQNIEYTSAKVKLFLFALHKWLKLLHIIYIHVSLFASC